MLCVPEAERGEPETAGSYDSDYDVACMFQTQGGGNSSDSEYPDPMSSQPPSETSLANKGTSHLKSLSAIGALTPLFLAQTGGRP